MVLFNSKGELVSSFQSNKQIEKCLFQLKYSNLVTPHYLSTLLFLLQIRDRTPRTTRVSTHIGIPGFERHLQHHDEPRQQSPLLSSVLHPVCESIYDHYCSSQPDPSNTDAGQQQALSGMSPGPGGCAPSRSGLNRMRETGAQLSFCKGEAKDKSTSLKAQSRPWISSLCLGLELQDYVFCDDE